MDDGVCSCYLKVRSYSNNKKYNMITHEQKKMPGLLCHTWQLLKKRRHIRRLHLPTLQKIATAECCLPLFQCLETPGSDRCQGVAIRA